MDFTFEEQELMAIYNPGTRLGLIQALNEMRTYLDEDEQELRTLTDSAVYKLGRCLWETGFEPGVLNVIKPRITGKSCCRKSAYCRNFLQF